MSEPPAASSSFFRDFVAGGVGGVFTVVVGHPFDTIKVRLQTTQRKGDSRPLYRGTLDCVRKTFAREGVKGFYSGMAAPLASVTPLLAFFFAGASLGRWLQQKTPDQPMTFLQEANSGALAGLLTSVIACPSEGIKCLLQVQRSQGLPRGLKFHGPMDVAAHLYRAGGIPAVYRGFGATILRDIPASAAFIAVYEWLKDLLAGGRKNELSPLPVLVAGGFAGMACWAVCIPTDMMKSRLQVAPKQRYPNGIRDVYREVMRTEGVRGLFRGFTPVMVRAFPANAACFLGVEMTYSLFRLWDRRGSRE